MIGKLSGVLEYRAADHVLIDVRGVGYVVYCSDRTLAALPARGGAVALFTDLLVREDNLQLFGFTSLVEREWYRLLITVQGVGAKAALAILSALGAEGVSRAIALGDWGAVKAAQGVGPKIAQRVVNELKDKAPQVMALDGALAEVLEVEGGAGEPTGAAGTPGIEPAAPALSRAPGGGSAQAAALSALVNLGYAQAEAASAVAQAGVGDDLDEAGLIRAALKLLAPEAGT